MSLDRPQRIDNFDLIKHDGTRQGVEELRQALSEVHGKQFEGMNAVVQLKNIASKLTGKNMWQINPEAKAATDEILDVALREIKRLIESI